MPTLAIPEEEFALLKALFTELRFNHGISSPRIYLPNTNETRILALMVSQDVEGEYTFEVKGDEVIVSSRLVRQYLEERLDIYKK